MKIFSSCLLHLIFHSIVNAFMFISLVEFEAIQKFKYQVEPNIVHGINAVDDVMVPHLPSKIF